MSFEPLIAQLVANAAPVRLVRPARVRLVRWAAATLLFLAPVSLLIGIRPDLTEMLARPGFLWSAASLAVAGLLAAAAAIVLSVPGAERTIAQRGAPVLCAIAWPVLLLSPTGASGAATTPAGVCALLIAAIASGPAWLLHRYVREGASAAPEWSTGLTVLAAACGAALVQQLHCPSNATTHLLSEHVLAVGVLAAGGAALGAVLRRRPARA